MNFNRHRRSRGRSHTRLLAGLGIAKPGAARRRQQPSFETLEARQLLSATAVQTPDRVEVEVSTPLVVNDEPQLVTRYNDPTVMDAFRRASNLNRYTEEQLQTADRWVVHTTSETTEEVLGQQLGVAEVVKFDAIPNTFIVEASASSGGALVDSLKGADQLDYFYPLVPHMHPARGLPNDPYVVHQWHLSSTGAQRVSNPDTFPEFADPGADISVEPVWPETTGKGVVIAITDDGVQYTHPDLAPNYDTTLDIDLNGKDFDPLPDRVTDFHGTSVAGVAAAKGNNHIGTAGVAYDATITGIRLISQDFTDEDEFKALTHLPEKIDIYNNSWGPEDFRIAESPGAMAAQGLTDARFLGRGGLGNTHTWSAGNGATDFADSSSLDGYASHRYTIAVGATDHTGGLAGYSEGGPNVFLAAPSQGGLGGIWTTDQLGNDGYNAEGFLNDPEGRDFFPDPDYTSRFGGTSSSTPVVSGVVALMLEENPTLTSRDIQHILARSARQTSAEDPAWIVNAEPAYQDPEVNSTFLMMTPLDPETGMPPDPPETYDLTGFVLTPDTPVDGDDGPVAHVPTDMDTGVHDLLMYSPLTGFTDHRKYPYPRITNGAGFTVHDSHATLLDAPLGALGHGSVDAQMAVEIAKNWWPIGPETFVTSSQGVGEVLAAEEILNGTLTIPGGPMGIDGFGAFFEEMMTIDYAAIAMGDGQPPQPPPVNTRGLSIPFTVTSTLAVESVELNVSFNNLPEEASGQLRIVLESPDGTLSDMVPYTVVEGPAWNARVPEDPDDPNDPNDPNEPVDPAEIDRLTQFEHTFTSVRHWGERSDGSTVEEIIPFTMQYTPRPWQVHFVNWSDSTIDVGAAELRIYGVPVGGGRIQGKVGLDVNGDDDFNFTGLINGETMEVVRDPGTEEGVFVLATDPPETLARGAVVYLDLDADGARGEEEPFFMTGPDGNYYFDVPLGKYFVGIEPPPGTEINFDAMQFPDNPATLTTGQTYEVLLEADDPSTPVQEHRELQANWILDPDAITFKGVVVADLNSDGDQDIPDPFARDRIVFVDLDGDGELAFQDRNFNFKYDQGRDIPLEPTDVSEADGTFEIVFAAGDPGYRGADFFNIVLLEKEGWTHVDPSIGSFREYAAPSDVLEFEFFTHPEFGLIGGTVFDDVNANGAADPGEDFGTGGHLVFLDEDGDGLYDAGERGIIPGADGVYTFFDLPPEHFDVRIIPLPGFAVTGPDDGFHSVDVDGGVFLFGRNFNVALLFGPDFNGDRAVNSADFVAWTDGFGTAADGAAEDGDADGDGDIDGDDFLNWQSNFESGVLVGQGAVGGGGLAATALTADEYAALAAPVLPDLARRTARQSASVLAPDLVMDDLDASLRVSLAIEGLDTSEPSATRERPLALQSETATPVDLGERLSDGHDAVFDRMGVSQEKPSKRLGTLTKTSLFQGRIEQGVPLSLNEAQTLKERVRRVRK